MYYSVQTFWSEGSKGPEEGFFLLIPSFLEVNS
jgi:hypothetical protein